MPAPRMRRWRTRMERRAGPMKMKNKGKGKRRKKMMKKRRKKSSRKRGHPVRGRRGDKRRQEEERRDGVSRPQMKGSRRPVHLRLLEDGEHRHDH
jgi:hypothetical protein